MLSLRNIKTVLADFTLGEINLDIEPAEYFVLLGPTGAGKTVLLETIAGLNEPQDGNVLVDGRDITHLPLHRRGLGMVFQGQCLFDHLRVCDNIAYALRVGRFRRREIKQRVEVMAEELEVSDLLQQYPPTLSGGERQRVALARTLINEPKCLLLDEPLSAIDAGGRVEMRRLLKSLQHKHNLTVLHVTHDFEEALALGDRIGVMNKGQLIEIGTPEQLFTRPNTHFAATFLGGENLFSGVVVARNSQYVFVTKHNEFSLPPQAMTGPAYLFIHPQDIVLSREPLDSSARNCVAGQVRQMTAHPAGTATIEIDAGDSFGVTVLTRTADEMNLKMGDRVHLTFKSSGTHVIAHCDD